MAKIDLITEAMAKYKGRVPDIYETGLRDGLRLAIAFLQICAGLPSELSTEEISLESEDGKKTGQEKP